MSTVYQGHAGNESGFATPVTITAATNATPIVVTAAAHGLLEGDRVEVVEVRGNTAANGVWYAHYVNANQVSLYAAWVAGAVATPSAGNGAFAAGGGESIAYLGLTPRTTIPADGDPLTAASVNVTLEDGKDGQVWLAERTGLYRLQSVYRQVIAQTPGVLASNGATVTGAWGWDQFGGAFGSGYLPVENGDMIEIEVTGCVVVSGNNVQIALRPSYELADYGVAFTGTTTALGTAGVTLGSPNATQPYFPVSLKGNGVVTMTRGKKLKPSLDNYGITAANPVYGWYGDVGFIVRTWRRNA